MDLPCKVPPGLLGRVRTERVPPAFRARPAGLFVTSDPLMALTVWLISLTRHRLLRRSARETLHSETGCAVHYI